MTAIDGSHWHRLFAALVESVDRPNFWNVLARSLHDLVEFDNWVVLIFSRDHRPVVLAECPVPGGGPDEMFQNYLAGFYLLDPFYIASLDEPRPGLFHLDDVAPDKFEAEDYYQRYFKLNIAADEVQFNLPLPEGQVLILSFGSRHRYAVAEMDLFSAISPWVLALMRQRMRHDEPHESVDPLPAPYILARLDKPAEVPPPEPGAKNTSVLTSRELETVHLLLSGFSSKAIAQKLKISPETVKGHRKHIYMKLGVRTHAELFAIYLQAKSNG